MMTTDPETDVGLALRLFEVDPAGAVSHFIASCRRWRWTDRWPDFTAHTSESGLRDILHLDPITRHSYEKPRGYPGDADLLDYLYDFDEVTTRSKKQLSPQAAAVCEAVWNSVEPESVRWRRQYLAGAINHAANAGLSVLSIACGHMRELDLLPATPRVPIAALDQDPESLAVLGERHPLVGLHQASIKELLLNRTKVTSAGLVYSAGLFDYLDDRAATRLIRTLWDLTEHRLIVANFAPYPTNLGSIELAMDWHLIYRSEDEMRALWEAAIPGAGYDLEIFRDPVGGVVYTVGHRR